MDSYAKITALSALAVVAVQQILKLKAIPVSFANRYPVPTNIILSIIAALIAVWQSNMVNPTTWQSWTLLVATIAVVAAIVYNSTLRNWKELRDMEGEPEPKK